jgi:hypothetical protein
MRPLSFLIALFISIPSFATEELLRLDTRPDGQVTIFYIKRTPLKTQWVESMKEGVAKKTCDSLINPLPKAKFLEVPLSGCA